MLDVAEVAQRSNDNVVRLILGGWPRNSHTMSYSHIRWLSRNGCIEQHSVTHYRLTPRGLAVRARLLARENPDA